MCWGGMCIILAMVGLSCLGVECVNYQHVQRYSTLYVYWIGACEVFGSQLCNARLCEGL